MTLGNTNRLARFWNGLKTLQNKVAIGLTVVLLLVLYFTVFAVVAICVRLLGKDLLNLEKPEPGSYWLLRQPEEHSLESFARQF